MRRSSTALTCLISVVTIFSCRSYAVEPLRMAYPTFAPFHYLNDKGEMEGLFYDIITEAVEKRLGVPLVWTAYPWTRCQQNVRTGHDDAITTVPTRDRAEYTRTHNKPFYKKHSTCLLTKITPTWKKSSPLKPLPILRRTGFL